MQIHLHVPENTSLKPSIAVVGVGGAGGNAINNMIQAQLEGAHFVVANTDAQALEHSFAQRRIQLGTKLTRGLGAGAAPDVGRAAAEESMEEILQEIEHAHMVFITAGMGGGTGTGAAPVIARLARERGILTVGVVTKPFHFEGAHRMRLAEAGLREMQDHVDTLIVIPNQNLFRIANEKTTFADAFKMADDVLHAGVRGVTDLITMPGLINLDFADIVSVMNKMGKAMMGTGEATGENRALQAAEAAIANPLLDNCSMKGAKGVLINITGGPDMTLFEVDEAANRIREEVDEDANIIFGSTFNPELAGTIRVSVVATGIDSELYLAQKAAAVKTAEPNTPQRSRYPFMANPPAQHATPTQETDIASLRATYSAKRTDTDRRNEAVKIYNTPTGFPPKQQSVFVAPKPQEPPREQAHAKQEDESVPMTARTSDAEQFSFFNEYMPEENEDTLPNIDTNAEAETTEESDGGDYLTTVATRPTFTHTETQKTYRAPQELAAAHRKPPTLSFLERIAASVRGKVGLEEQSSSPSPIAESLLAEDVAHAKMEDLDIPAFLRKKSKS